MKTFDTNANGGMPTYLKDLRFMETTHKEVFEAILKPFANIEKVFILSGCVRSVSGGIVSITEGWIVLQGEVMFVEAQNYPLPTGGNLEYWVSTTIDVVGGNKDFFDGSNHDTWKDTVGRIEIGGVVPNNSQDFSTTLNYFEVYTNAIVNPSWNVLPNGHNEFTAAGVASRYLKDNSGMVHLSGYMTANDPTGYDVGTLPVGFRPADDFKFLHTYFINATSVKVIRMIIQTDGVITSVDDDFLQTTELNGWPAFKAV